MSVSIRRRRRINTVTRRGLVTGRTVMSAGAIIAPHLTMNIFGAPVGHSATAATFRMFGIRNALLAYQLARPNDKSRHRYFYAINVGIDVFDALAIAVAGSQREISARASLIGTSIALSAGALGVAAVASWEPEP